MAMRKPGQVRDWWLLCRRGTIGSRNPPGPGAGRAGPGDLRGPAPPTLNLDPIEPSPNACRHTVGVVGVVGV